MAKHKRNFDYFDFFDNITEQASKAAVYLHETFTLHESDELGARVNELHTIENDADLLKHDMMSSLAHEFITPIEREDIVALAQELDNVVDAIEEVLRRAYMYDIKKTRPELSVFTELIVRCCAALQELTHEFRGFKSSKTIGERIVAVNTLESEGDVLHAQSIRTLFTDGSDMRETLIWLNLFEELETCLDKCEDAADIIESVIMKNT